MNVDTFCSDVVPDFTPLGGNRPDCAVVMAAALGLVDEPSLLLLPPDVLDTAMAMLCAIIIIRSNTDVVPHPNGRGHLSCRLEAGSDAALGKFSNFDYSSFDRYLPWREFDTVCLQIALPDSITTCPHFFLQICYRLVFVDLRKTKLQSVGDRFLSSCDHLEELLLPDTLHTVGECFLQKSNTLATIDLRNTQLQTVGSFFLRGSESLAAVHLPDSLHTVGKGFLSRCHSLVSIDLRNTQLHKAEDRFMSNCERLTAVHLPETLHAIGYGFLDDCRGIPSWSDVEGIVAIKRRIGCAADTDTSASTGMSLLRVDRFASSRDWLSTKTLVILAVLAAAVAVLASVPSVNDTFFGIVRRGEA